MLSSRLSRPAPAPCNNRLSVAAFNSLSQERLFACSLLRAARALSPFCPLVARDDAVLDENHAVGKLRDVVLVRDQHDGVALAVQLVEQGHDLSAGLRIQVAGGLIGQDDGGLIDQSARDGHALALTAG